MKYCLPEKSKMKSIDDVNVGRLSYIRAPSGCMSFSDTCRCCELASRLNVGVVCKILGKDRYFTPNMDPHLVYDFNNNLIGEELLNARTAAQSNRQQETRYEKDTDNI